ncbi:MAG: glycosyltransferase family 4 protein [Flavobacterium sp.]|nr:glycosyltransferase family 4 protein [Pedobacter sp.]
MHQNQVLIIGSVWPEPKSSAAGIRMMELINLFGSKGWQVSFASPAADSLYATDLNAIEVNKIRIKINDSGFNEIVKNIKPSIVIFDRFIIEEQFGWRVSEVCPNALRILNTEDLHCLRRGRHKAVKELFQFKTEDLLNSNDAKREIASILRCDLSLVISRYEMRILQNLFKVSKNLLHYFPFISDKIIDTERISWPSFLKRQHFMTIGNFLHEPNLDSVLYLQRVIWPLIREQLPEAELHVFGAYPPAKVLLLNNPEEGFYIKGRIADAYAVMQNSRVCLAPLRFGAGLKGKLFEAMRCGTPSVTSHIGAEGMHHKLPWNGFIEDEPIKFAAKAVKLYTNELIWNNAQNNGVKIVNECFNKEDILLNLINKLDEVRLNLKERRLKNFTGAMLMHHTMAGTKYMSRWIEAKNSIESESSNINFLDDTE